MRNMLWVRVLFVIAGLYDGLLGLIFLIAPGPVFERFGVTPPNHIGYVQFPAGVLLVFAALFFAVATRPRRNRGLIPYGIGLKVCYCAVVFGHWGASGIPGMWKPFAIADVVFALLFVWAWGALLRKV